MKYFILAILVIALIITGYFSVKQQKEIKDAFNNRIEHLASQIKTAKVVDCFEYKDFIMEFYQKNYPIQSVIWNNEQAKITVNGKATCYEMDWKLANKLQTISMFFLTSHF